MSRPLVSRTGHRRGSHRAVLLAAAVLGLAAPPVGLGQSQDGPRDALAASLTAAIQRSGFRDRMAVHVVDVPRDQALFAHRAETAMNPASNQKIITAATALRRLGPAFQMRTALQGSLSEGRVALLTLRGSGDPTLRRSDLRELAEALVDRGVRRVGAIRVDATYFDEQVDPPAYEQQPRELSTFRSPVSAVAVDRNAYALRLLPGGEAGAPARVRIPGASHFVIDNGVTTTADGPPRVVLDPRSRDDGRMALRIRGTVPANILGVTYRRRVEHPRRYAGHVLSDALRGAGVRLPDTVRVGLGRAPAGAPILASRRSPPVAVIIRALGKDSDNFTAEMLLKVVAAETSGRPGSTPEGCRQAAEVLREAGAAPSGATRLVNGSGLFEGNAVAPETFTRLLSDIYRRPDVRPEFLAHLATAGVDGTLSQRLRGLPAGVTVRAKTGTLASVASLSGYVTFDDGDEEVLAFSIIGNGIPGQVAAFRRVADELVGILAAHVSR